MNTQAPGFGERFLAALQADPEFEAEARRFDGSILVEIGDERLWLPTR